MKTIKTTITKTKYVLLALLVAFSFSCSPEDGNDGAIGPAGTNGVDGANGTDGNANVVSVLIENQAVSTGITTFSVPELTQDIFDTGVVYGYVTVNGNDYWETIPIVSGGSVMLDIDSIRVGEIDIETTFNQSGLNFRFILVASSSSKLNIDLGKMSYEEVMDYFGLDY